MSESLRPAGFQGYHRVRSAREDAELTHVGPDTPCGEYLRRYWQPVVMSEELGALPRVVRVLGEDLVLFPRRIRTAGAPAPSLCAPGRVAGVRNRGRAGHHLLLPRLALRHRRHHPPGGIGAPRQPHLPQRGAGSLSGPRTQRPAVRLLRTAGGAPAVSRIRQRADAGHHPQGVFPHHALQLAPDLREHPGPHPRAAPARPIERGSVRRGIRYRPGDRVPGHPARHDERPDPPGR